MSGQQQQLQPSSRAFTLVELLVVIGIISLLISILLPSLARARRAAISVQCMSNLRQVGMANAMYQADHQGAFPATLFYRDQYATPARFLYAEIWDCKLAPYLGITLKTDPTHADPLDVTGQTSPSPLLLCPQDHRVSGYTWGASARSYSASRTLPKGIGRDYDGVMWMNSAGTTGNIKINMVKRTSETVFLFEYWSVHSSQTDGNRQWRPGWAGTDGWLGAGGMPTDALNNFFYHDGKLSVLWCDGHVTQEDPRTAYTAVGTGKRNWWTRAE